MTSYAELADWLKTRGIGSYLQNGGPLVVSNENPARPGRNCFWVALKDQVWHVGTFLPVAYRVPAAANIGSVCEAVFRSSPTVIYTIAPVLIERFRLQELAAAEVGAL